MRSPLLLAWLAGLYPCLFVATHNWHLYTAPQIAALLIGVPLVTAVGILLARTLVGVGFKKKLAGAPDENGRTRADRWTDAVTGVIAVVCAALLSSLMLSDLGTSLLVIVVVVGALSLVAAKITFLKGLKPVSSALLLLVILALASGVMSYTQVSGQRKGQTWHTQHREANEQIQFKTKPNVYFLLTESYPNRRALEEVFNFDNESFYAAMEDRGFAFSHEGYATYHTTLTSLPAMFAMEHHNYTIRFGLMDTKFGRHVLAGAAYNAVLDTFKNNGYGAQYIHSINYQWHPLVPAVDYYWPPSLKGQAAKDLLRPVVHGVKDLVRPQNDSAASSTVATPEQRAKRAAAIAAKRKGERAALGQVLDKRLLAIQEDGRPFFTYVYISDPGHSATGFSGMNQDQIDEALATFRAGHGETIASANVQILSIMDKIIASDPGAVIIVTGDHGSYGYRQVQNVDGQPIRPETVTLDRLGILVAARFPDGSGLSPENDVFTNINLFRHVFAHLAEKPSVLDDAAKDGNAYLGLMDGVEWPGPEENLMGVIAIEDGVVLKEWKPLILDQK